MYFERYKMAFMKNLEKAIDTGYFKEERNREWRKKSTLRKYVIFIFSTEIQNCDHFFFVSQIL